MLVLGMSSLTGATFHISVNGHRWNPSDQILVNPGETVTFGIWTDADVPLFRFYDMVLIANTFDGPISGGVQLIPFDVPCILYPASEYVHGLPKDYDGGLFTAVNFDNPIPAGTTIFDEILFRREVANAFVVTLAGLDEGWNYTGEIYEQVTFYDIPEPATILLLSLGAVRLFRCRSRQVCSRQAVILRKSRV